MTDRTNTMYNFRSRGHKNGGPNLLQRTTQYRIKTPNSWPFYDI